MFAFVINQLCSRPVTANRLGPFFQNDPASDPFRFAQIFFEKQSRGSESFAHVVESVSRIIPGETFSDRKLDSEKIANRVGVFRPVQSANHSGLRRILRGGGGEILVDPFHNFPALFFIGTFAFFGRHFPGGKLGENFLPRLRHGGIGKIGCQRIEAEIGFGHIGIVAFDAVLIEKSMDRIGVKRIFRCRRGKARRKKEATAKIFGP